MSFSTSKKTALILFASGIAIAAASLAASVVMRPTSSSVTSASAPAASQPDGSGSPVGRVVARVGDQEITEADVAVAGTGERPVVIDRLVSQIVAANLAEKEFGSDARQAADRARREVLSALYLQRKAQTLRTAVTDADVKAFYDTEVKDEQFTAYRVTYSAAQDVAALEPIVAAITNGKASSVQGKFTAMNTSGDGFMRANEMPMGVGQLIRAMKVGEYSRPVVLRNGVFIFHVAEVKANPKPAMDSVKESIRDLIVARQLDAAMQAARKDANIRVL